MCLPPSATAGSSPLTRGKPRASLVSCASPGLIPAHAGKTMRPHGTSHPRAAHPRSRGENSCALMRAIGGRGSSPLTRGKRAAAGLERGTLRLIPAHAGKTGSYQTPTLQGRAHPRSRGENIVPCFHITRDTGSSPLTRGKLRTRVGDPAPWGLIPAHAGKTQTFPSPHSHSWAHPRSRGENQTPRSLVEIPGGSSPLTRGKPAYARKRPCPLGLIPAHAGKTGFSLDWVCVGWAHPRSRGENHCVLLRDDWGFGSSPLTRGKLISFPHILCARGLIPAHAGKTS